MGIPLKQEFLLRRLHSLTGIAMGAFLFNHFLTNSFIFAGRDAFNHKVHLIHSIPGIVLLEIALIATPFLFHMVYGTYIMFYGTSKPLAHYGTNLAKYEYTRNGLYTIQRLTAAIVAVFVIWHVWELRFYVNYAVDHYIGGKEGEFVLGAKFYDYLVMKFESPFFAMAYIVGVAAAIIHWANGLCTFCMSWGITVGPTSQKLMGGVAVGVALVYTALIGLSIYGLLVPPDAPQAIEELKMIPSDVVNVVYSYIPGASQPAASLF
jgi:succinate dehydrogenase / fumarate reductase cytochrome b subunit